uniref:Uncharacterized protein n=1 Tax=Globisporangium ultimum (strain ATCC 200006 / CBS 805.95 / DAOM BR144) TaxID=431595 RepID=K3WGY7_GLOUD
MDDIYGEMEQNWKNGRFRLPLKFISFHDSEIMFLFVRAAIGYALAFVKVKTLQKDHRERAFEDPKLMHDANWRERIASAIDTQSDCATAMASAYARLVLHCSNYENHKEDEHFFECIYFFVCSVVKLSIPPEYWKTMEEELGFLFRGAQFSCNVKTHTTTAHKEAAAAVGAEKEAALASSAAKKIQNLSATSDKEQLRADATRFVLPKARPSHFTESVPVKRIVSEMDATKSRAERNIGISQAIRERIHAQRSEEQKRQLEAVVTPRQSIRLELYDPAAASIPTALMSASSARGTCYRAKVLVSPRTSMKATYTTRSPALNHLLPTIERLRAGTAAAAPRISSNVSQPT